ncbi:MAG: hypothetical protein RLY78_3834 [Pseudomonadota bacterium]|jgi:hypothetical protein
MSNHDPQVPGQAAAAGPGAVAAPGWRPALLARYAHALMGVQPPAPRAALALHTVGPVGGAQQAVWPALLAWCADGARTGAVVLPWQRPSIARPLAVARLDGPRGSGRHPLAQALGEHLSRDAALAALPGRGAQLALRLRVKAAELCWWRAAPDDAVWDAGWLRTDLPDLAARLAAWSPRRPTLLLADAPAPQVLAGWIDGLRALAAHTRQPVRLLLLPQGAPVPLDAPDAPITLQRLPDDLRG